MYDLIPNLNIYTWRLTFCLVTTEKYVLFHYFKKKVYFKYEINKTDNYTLNITFFFGLSVARFVNTKRQNSTK